MPRIGRLADPWTADIMVLNPHPSVFKDGELSPLPCAEFASQYGSNVCQCAGELVSRFNVGAMFSKLCPWLQNCSFHLPFFGNCEEFVEKALLATSIGAAVAWLIVPEDWWDEWLCGYAPMEQRVRLREAKKAALENPATAAAFHSVLGEGNGVERAIYLKRLAVEMGDGGAGR